MIRLSQFCEREGLMDVDPRVLEALGSGLLLLARRSRLLAGFDGFGVLGSSRLMMTLLLSTSLGEVRSFGNVM